MLFRSHDALAFGPREEMLHTAWRRVRAEPDRYLDHVWGEHEWGGTSVLYVSDVDLAPLGLDRGTTHSVLSITDPVIHATPKIAVSVAAVMTGLSWIVARRQRLMAETDEGGEDRE